MNCGSSSRLKRRSRRPARVTRGSSAILKAGSSSFSRSTSSPSCSSAPWTIVRNFSTVNGLPSLPARRWRKRTGRPESSRISSALASSTGESRISSRPPIVRSIARFSATVERGGSEKRKSSTGSSASRFSSMPGTEQAEVLGQEGERQARRLALLDQPLGRRLAHLLLGDDHPLDVALRGRSARCRRSSRAGAGCRPAAPRPRRGAAR